MPNPLKYIDPKRKADLQGLELTEKVVFINRVAKVVKGGRRFNFTAVVVVGDGQGHVGMGMGKAHEVPEAIRKGGAVARRSLIRVPMAGTTVPHPIWAKFAASRVLIKPAPPGAGLKAGGSARAVLEMAGVRDVAAKSLGNNNAANLAKATILALSRLQDPKEAQERRQLVKGAAS